MSSPQNFPDPKAASELGRRFSSAIVLFHSALAESFGLSPTDWKCGELVRRLGPMTPTQLAERTGLSTAATTLVIDRLVKAGFIERTPHPTDRRKVILQGTANPDLESRIDAAFSGLTGWMTSGLAAYTPEQLWAILDFVEQTTVVTETETLRLRQQASPAGKKD